MWMSNAQSAAEEVPLLARMVKSGRVAMLALFFDRRTPILNAQPAPKWLRFP
jgi:hypothetical protein